MAPQNENNDIQGRTSSSEQSASLAPQDGETDEELVQRVMRMSLEFHQQEQIQQQERALSELNSNNGEEESSYRRSGFYPDIDNQEVSADVEESWRRSSPGTPFAAAAAASPPSMEEEEKAEEGVGAYHHYMNREYGGATTAAVEEIEEDSKMPSASLEQSQSTEAVAYAEAAPAASDGFTQPFASAAASYEHFQIPPEPASASAMVEEDADLIALKRAAYGGYSDQTMSAVVGGWSTDNANPSSRTPQAAEATVVDYDLHPSELDDPQTVQADYVGQDYNVAASMSDSHHEAASAAPVAAAAAASISADPQPYAVMGEVEGGEGEVEDNIATAAQATILQDDDDNNIHTEEAIVMQDSGANVEGVEEDLDTKPPAVDNSWDAGAGEVNSNDSDMPGEAQVVDIAEEVHPSEFTDESSPAQAELVGSDFNTAFAVTMNSQPSTSPTNEQHAEATIVPNESNQDEVEIEASNNDSGVQATLVVEQEAARVSPAADPSTIVATFVDAGDQIIDGDQVEAVAEMEESTISEQGATPVAAILETPEYEPSTVKTLPPHLDGPPRATSDPTPRPGHNPFVDDPNDTPAMSRDGLEALDIAAGQPEWMSTPAFGGHADPNLFVEAIRPPSQGDISREPEIPAPQPVANTATSSTMASSTARSEGSGSHSLHSLSSSIARGTGNVMEMLFGDTNPIANSRRSSIPARFQSESSLAGSILPRSLLPSSVIFSESTKTWVATVNTNQKALDQNNVEASSKALRAFSVQSKRQALCLAKQWAPPRMHPFGSNPTCFICEAKFAVFKRACHCRNCGVCVCNSCSVQWPSKMLPLTYNIKKASSVNVCKSCDWLCTSFRLALLDGDYDKAVALYSTGNVNLTTPFNNVKGELFYPVHCAVLGNNLQLLKWLVDENCCPLRSLRISGNYTSILTSKGRSLLGIALENRNVGILRYLVVAKRMSLSHEKSLDPETLVQCLDLVLRVLPEEVLTGQSYDGYRSQSDFGSPSSTSGAPSAPVAPEDSFSSPGPNALLATNHRFGSGNDDTESNGSVQDACIICFSNTIDCVATPCGHQICCLECSNNISRCPVCATECSFMRVFKP